MGSGLRNRLGGIITKNVIEISNDIEHAKNDLKGLSKRILRAYESCQKAGLLDGQDCFDLGAAAGTLNRLETAAYKASKNLKPERLEATGADGNQIR